MSQKHWIIFSDNNSSIDYALDLIFNTIESPYFLELKKKKGAIFSKAEIIKFIDEENRHGIKIVTRKTSQSLKSMSSGEQKKALLDYILKTKPDFIVLDNPFDNLDRKTRTELKERLKTISDEIYLIQIIGRESDALPFIKTSFRLKGNTLQPLKNIKNHQKTIYEAFDENIPKPLTKIRVHDDILIRLENISVSYLNKPILRSIHWTIKKGEFWELRGDNGSGKTTLLSMITGENPKGYGQELYLFGQKKGSGESVWEIKEKIGYFTPSMTESFKGIHSVENMVISGLNDSVGLYIKATEAQLNLAQRWLKLAGFWDKRHQWFNELSEGNKRLVMCIRAMIKHPPLLILDETTAGLDDTSAALFVSLVNIFAKESDTAIIFVSHRDEPGLLPQYIYELQITDTGSVGKMLK
ncbi:ATP-binding cassette domain-containing protein [Costertonia aggregata]|uniref:ATP-binding cassette domain-containing protein n=1 Tax=Costertonia aggregata TaxID=343403 RepID=A0A7H9ARW1_9FLAO|nr:ATP-binding cassette domain-containing protein [Costertonia aggregata]QLG46180.1 ATP-binding cassette domain-containing protein [Costertonia aggregata]